MTAAYVLYGFQVSFRRYSRMMSWQNNDADEKPKFTSQEEYYDHIVQRIIDTNIDDCSKFVLSRYTEFNGDVISEVPCIVWSQSIDKNDDGDDETILHVGCKLGTVRAFFSDPAREYKGEARFCNRVKELRPQHDQALDQIRACLFACHPSFDANDRALYVLLDTQSFCEK